MNRNTGNWIDGGTAAVYIEERTWRENGPW